MTAPTPPTHRPFVLAEAAALLARTPALLDAWLRALPPTWATATEGGESWSVFDVVGHLIHGERTDWIPRARLILAAGDTQTFDTFDRRAQFDTSRGYTLAELLDQFAAARQQNLGELASLNLSQADLERRGRHPAFGTVTLGELLATWVAHDYDHVAQIARVLAHQYADEVGPWRAYLRIISGQPG
jgi:uncharacterized damage-inducible protein DinB